MRPAEIWDYADTNAFEGVNEHEIGLFGMKRGGQHAILNWLFGLIPGPTYFLDNAQYLRCSGFAGVGHGQNFYCEMFTGSRVAIIDGTKNPFAKREIEYDPGSVRPLTDPVTRLSEMREAERAAARTLGLPDARAAYVWNLQDFDLSRIGEVPWRRVARGTSRRRTLVTVLRDPYNWMASRWSRAAITSNGEEIIRRWLVVAREQRAQTAHLALHADAVVHINYNRWFSETTYRAEIARALGYANTDRGLNVVSSEGGGSSIDGQRFDGQAQAMPVLERFKKYETDPDYRSVFVRFPELAEIGEFLFGLKPF